jgi:hypothetical protein
MIKNYSNFQEILLEKLLSESIVYFSPKFRRMISKIDSPITKDLIDIEKKDIKNDVTFIDIDDREGYASFKTMKNAKRVIDNQYSTFSGIVDSPDTGLTNALYDIKSDIWTKSRNPIAIGRLINSILPDKFNNKEIEDFINKYKSRQTRQTEQFEIVEGDDIYKWYRKENYLEQKGSLGGSCMRSGKKEWFRIYTENPEVCKMLILTDENENGDTKLKGRALLWKVFNKFEWFLDRQYTISDADVEKFRNYAIEKGWAYKTNNTHSDFTSVTFDGKKQWYQMTVSLKKANTHDYDYEYYPYLDTFRRYDPSRGELYNDNDEDEDDQYILDDTGGGHSRTTGSRVWSDYHDDYLEEDEAVYSDDIETYIRRSAAVEIRTGTRRYYGWYPEDSDNVVINGWNDQYIHVDDAIYSEHYDYYILESDASSVIIKLDNDGDCDSDSYYIHDDDEDFISLSELEGLNWFRDLNDKFGWTRTHAKISEELLRKDPEGNWVLRIFDIKVFKTDDDTEVDYLTEIDAEALGVRIDKDNMKIVQKYDYYKNMSEKTMKSLINGLSRLLRPKQLKLNLDDDNSKSWEYKRREEKRKITIINTLEYIENLERE